MPRPVGRYPLYDESAISRWSKDDIPLHDDWRTDWSEYCYWSECQGAPGDLAWEVEHAYGFAGPAIPQAYFENREADQTWILFRVGNRYLAWTRDPDLQLCALSLTDDINSRGDPESHTHPTAITEMDMYRMWFFDEVNVLRRNRWIEQAERGGLLTRITWLCTGGQPENN
jgi:hypothetical protein